MMIRPNSHKAVTHPRKRARRERALARRQGNLVAYTSDAELPCPVLVGCHCRQGSYVTAAREVATLKERLA